MEYGEKYIKYKGRVVFGRQRMPYFDRYEKTYAENDKEDKEIPTSFIDNCVPSILNKDTVIIKEVKVQENSIE